MAENAKTPDPSVQQVHPIERARKLALVANRAFSRFHGQFDDLEKAIGMLMLGDYVGWKVLVLIHNKRTIRKYEEILGINVRQFFQEEGPAAMRANGYQEALKTGNFWKAVSGDISIEGRRALSGNKNANIQDIS